MTGISAGGLIEKVNAVDWIYFAIGMALLCVATWLLIRLAEAL